MTYRIGWLSPLTPTSGVGTFTNAITEAFPKSFAGEPIDLTLLHLGHRRLYQSRHRCIEIDDTEKFHQVLSLFDLLIYNIGNNREHHEPIYNLLRVHPGIVVCHDYVYQHYLADRSLRSGRTFASYAALLTKYGGHAAADDYLRRSRITSRTGQVRYSPWDSEYSVHQPMSEAILDLGSALVVHSAFAERQAEKSFEGPILRLGMPHDQKHMLTLDDTGVWQRVVAMKRSFHTVSFGYIQPTKCIDLVLSAIGASDTLRRQLRYTIAGYVGDDSYYQQLRGMVHAMSLQDIVTFETNVSDARLSDLMREADIFVNLRKPNTEGSSASLIEQLNVGRPVIVLDSGCYGEITPGGAVVCPADATSLDIQNALTNLIAKPELMPSIGKVGQAFARTWTCGSYAERLVRFAFENRDLLRQRAELVGIVGSAGEVRKPNDENWAIRLARARLSLRYLDRNMLALDPEVVIALPRDELCIYVAHVIFGMFDNARLDRGLARFFAGRDGVARYWACFRFALIADAVFSGDVTAQERLALMTPSFDPELWCVLEHLPPAQYFAAGCLLLARRMPSTGEFASAGHDNSDGFPKRLRMAEFVRGLSPAAGLCAQARQWFEEPCLPETDGDLPVVDRDFEWSVGSVSFRSSVDLSGFYGIEPDHVWTRGTRGFIGLRLGRSVTNVKLLVRHVDASPGQTCAITLSSGTASTSIVAWSDEAAWISLDLPLRLARSRATTWLQLSTDRAASPPASPDPRSLGVCLYQLRLTVRANENGVTAKAEIETAA